ncbi:MAG: hypothetical protein IKT66_00810 [Alistipes sp.]|nr:hypothetical protein [Alistipes sp.]
MKAIVFRADDSLVLYRVEGEGVETYLFDSDADTEAVVRHFGLIDVEEWRVENLASVLAEGDVVESRLNLYIRTSNGVESYSKQKYILPLIDTTERMVSEIALSCNYRPLSARQSQRLRGVVEDVYITMRRLPDMVSFPIFATYNYVEASDSDDDRLKVTTIKTSTEAWREAQRAVRGSLFRSVDMGTNEGAGAGADDGDGDGVRWNVRLVFSYCAKLILGVC